MRKVAIFGNAGGGKSRLARRLSQITGLPHYGLDDLEYPQGRYRRGEPEGGRLAPEAFAAVHAEILHREKWIIDGYAGPVLDAQRFADADTLIHIDLPVALHYWGVTRRLLAGLIEPPPGWPVDSPLWRSTLSSYRVIPLCEAKLTPRYRQLIAQARGQRAYRLRSYAEIAAFLREMEREQAGS
jgi:adenylate kinase family enzyme